MKILNALIIGTAAAALFAAADARAEWPEKPIQFIIPFGAGGGADGRISSKVLDYLRLS